MSSPRLRALIWDVDGTLGDTMPMVCHVFRETFRKFRGEEWTDEQIHERFGPTDDGILAKLIPAPRLEEAREFYYGQYRDCLGHWAPEPFSGVRDLVREVSEAGIRQAVLTGKGQISAEHTLRVWGLEPLFEEVVVGSPDHNIKQQNLAALVNRWGLPGREAGYLGDSPSDIDDARNAGCLALAAGWAGGGLLEAARRKNPDQFFATLEELRAWLFPCEA